MYKVGDKVICVETFTDNLGVLVPRGSKGVVDYVDYNNDLEVAFTDIGLITIRSYYVEKIVPEKAGLNIDPQKLDELVGAEFTKQSARHNSGKTQVRELDPAFIMGLGEVLTASRSKYEEGNWMKETKFSTPYESAMRHLMKFWSGEEFDEETGKHHLLHAATNLMFLYYHTRSGVGIDDRLFKKDKK